MQLFFSDIDVTWQVFYFAKRLDSLLRQPKLTTRIGWPESELNIKNTSQCTSEFVEKLNL